MNDSPYFFRAFIKALAPVAILAFSWVNAADAIPKKFFHPQVAATAEEIARLKKAWLGTGVEHDIAAAFVTNADASLDRPIEFPPRGGQHNQWYQCAKCQLGLVAVDATHHRCPKCGTVYSGEPYDDVIFGKIHGANLRTASSAAWAFTITGEKKYAALAVSILSGYADRYLDYPYHDAARKQSRSGGHLFEQTLDEAYSSYIHIAPTFDLCEGQISESDKKKIREKLLRPLVDNILKHRATDGKNNWQTLHNSALLWLGACLEDPTVIDAGLNDPTNGFFFQMKASITEDGMWYEGSWGYHYYAMGALAATAEGARRLGVDLWSQPALRKVFFLPASYAMPDGLLPRFGDDPGTFARSYGPTMEAAYHAYRDPALLRLLPQSNQWSSVFYGRNPEQASKDLPEKSELFRDSGHSILRTGGEKKLTAVFKFSPYGGFHDHFDKLSFVFYGYGAELGVDPGRAKSQAYNLPIHTDWYKATLGHNAVLVNQKPQAAADGELSLFAEANGFALSEARLATGFQAVSQRRLLFQSPEYLLVLDRLEALDDAPRTFDWVYHGTGDSFDMAGLSAGAAWKDYPGMEYIQDIRTGETSGMVRGAFASAKVATHLLMDGQSPTQVLAGNGPLSSVNERVPLLIARRAGKSQIFLAALEPTTGGAAPEISALSWKKNGDELVIEVKRGGDADRLTLTGKTASAFRGGKAVLNGTFLSLRPLPAFKAKKKVPIDDFDSDDNASWAKRENVQNFSIASGTDPERKKVLSFIGDFSKTPYAWVKKTIPSTFMEKVDPVELRFWAMATTPSPLQLKWVQLDGSKEISYSSAGLTLGPAWKEYVLPLNAFRGAEGELNTALLRKTTLLFFSANKGKEESRISIDDISFY